MPQRTRWFALMPLIVCLLAPSGHAQVSTPPAERRTPAGAARPKLVLLLVMDQFRYEYMVRHRASFVPGGFNLLLERGAVFANCHYAYASTLTAPGHAVIATGSYPDSNGIIGNEWFDRASGKRTTADQDVAEKLLGAEPASPGASPHWVIGSTFADELRLATGGRAHIVSISPKARSAIIPAGKSPEGAYWFDTRTLHAISSTYYKKDLPDWVKEYNARSWADQYAGKPWVPVDNPKGEPFLTFPKPTDEASRRKLAQLVTDSPFITDIQLGLAKIAVEKENLGRDATPDFLSLSISATDLVGHDFGPEHPRTRDTILRADRSLADFFRFLDARIGLANVWIALSADHGVAPMPEQAREQRLDAGRIANRDVIKKVEAALGRAYAGAPEDRWVEIFTVPHLYLNQALLRRKQINPADATRRASDALMETGAFSAVVTRQELAGCRPGTDLMGKVCLAFYPERGGDLYLVFKPFWMYELNDNPLGTTHGSPWSYDTHVPLLFVGAPFRAGTYYTPSTPADLAVTMAAALGIDAPAAARGRVLAEAMGTLPAPSPAGAPPAVSPTRAER